MTNWQYDAAGNMTSDGGAWSFTYDATGQQATASISGTQMSYDGDRLRGKKNENGYETFYLRSSVLGGQVVAEMNSGGGWTRGYVYLGGQLLALQQAGVVWTHQDPVTKSQRLTDSGGNVTSVVDLDPWGGETARSSNSWRQPRKYTSYERDAIGSDEAMHRRYNSWWRRFEQPDPYDGSASLADPQSLNRYSYVQNDPVNFIDPTGLCIFNISITNSAGVSNGTLQSARNEIGRIFRAAGHGVVFNNPRFPGINTNRSYNLTIQTGGRTPGGTDGGRDVGYITNQGRASTERLAASIADGGSIAQALGRNETNFGRALGRVSAHESMHYFLQIFQDQHTSTGLMQTGFTGREWFDNSAAGNANFQLTAAQAAALSSRCPPLTTTTTLGTEITPRPLLPLPGRGGSGGGPPSGGGGGGGGGGPFSGWTSLDWLRFMHARQAPPPDAPIRR